MLKLASLYSGSSGNSVYISSKNTHILVDAGLSGKRIEESLAHIGGNIKNIQAILISHEHSDHIMGAGVLSRRYKIPIYANEKTWEAMRLCIKQIDPECIRVFSTGQPFKIGDIEVNTFNTPHDAVEPVGFNFCCDRKKATIATDIGHINRSLLNNLVGSDIILLESNHDIEMLKVGRYPWPLKQRIMSDKGHLCNDIAAKVVAYLAVNGTKKFLLGHLSKENNFPELAFQTVKNALTEKSITTGRDVYVGIAYRDRVSESLVI
ncbi:MAG: MBL fold metallo-hydrolase [Clostridiaceae bacterium]|jgi:phosphoribosyl 1,2-cyclic phosphodiesterase|nr:MBL fold metallo-hydrolase [Clostridiaceae bacterium]